LDKKPAPINTQTENDNKMLQTLKIPNNNKLPIPPDLECLRQVIMSQHSALTNDILELGHLYLNFTNIIEKKKESSNKLLTDQHIPRSLRIKCELTTSPSYENDPIYQELKQELHNCVKRFTTESIAIMKTWSVTNIQLLNKDRCNSYLKKAIHILDGLASYWSDIFHPISWPPEIDNPLLLILKIFFSTEHTPDITDIEKYLDTPTNELLLTATNIITKYNNVDTNSNIIHEIDLNTLGLLDHEQATLIMETLSSFDSILRATTITLWDNHSLKIRQTEASLKFQAKMEASRTLSATTATMKSINKAIHHINNETSTNQITQVRISNIEKQLTQQRQTANEILNHLKAQKNSKNSKGSHLGQVTSSDSRSNPFINTQNIVDLTTLSQSPTKNSETSTNTLRQKRRRTIQWDADQRQEYNPSSTPLHTFARSTTLNPTPTTPHYQNPFKTPSQSQTLTSILSLHGHPTQHTNNPFTQDTNQDYHGGRTRGRKRGSSRNFHR